MKYRYQSGPMVYEVELDRRGDGYWVSINGVAYDVELLDTQPGALSLRMSDAAGADAGGATAGSGDAVAPAATAAPGAVIGAPFRPEMIYWGAESDATRPWSMWLSEGGCTYRLERPAGRRSRGGAAAADTDTLRAPMPAQVRGVQVAEGEVVAAGQTLLLLEAMKMEIKVQAHRAGRVARLRVKAGDTVERDQVIVELAPEDAGLKTTK